MTGAAAPEAPDAVAGFDLDTLLAGAARLRPTQPALASGPLAGPDALSFAQLDADVAALAAGWRALGLEAGERVVLLVEARASHVVALLAALRARLDVALLPVYAAAAEIARFAARVDAVAIAGPTEGALAETMLAAASMTDGVRVVVATEGRADGAAPLEPRAPDAAPRRGPPSRVITADSRGAPCAHEQRALVAAALDLVSRARIGMRTPIVTTIAPARIAGLVAGPIAGLMAGAPVALHGPFSGRAFAALLEDLAGAHLVVPGALLPALAAAGLYDQRVAASVLLLERCGSARELADVPRAPAPAGRRGPALVDVVAVAEHAVVAEPRGADGATLPLLDVAHYLTLDGRTFKAVELRRAPVGDGERVWLEGVAVSSAGA